MSHGRLTDIFLCCDVMLLFRKMGHGLVPLKRNPAANVCTCPKSGIWCTVVVACLCNLYVFLVSRFLYRLDRWFSRLNGFALIILGPFRAFCSVWAKARCWSRTLTYNTFINCYLDEELSHWHSYHIFLNLL